MPDILISWLPKACRNAAMRQRVSTAIIEAISKVSGAEIEPQNCCVKFAVKDPNDPKEGFTMQNMQRKDDKQPT